jgi:hypothetical protein
MRRKVRHSGVLPRGFETIGAAESRQGYWHRFV